MTPSDRFPLVAVDIGNSRVKFGLFDGQLRLWRPAAGTGMLPLAVRTLELAPHEARLDDVADWLGPQAANAFSWWIGSVERSVASRLVDWLRARDVERITLLASADLPLEISLPRPDMVGIDRLLGAVAANRLRRPDTPAIVVDLGTAITVDMISASGQFLGGAILPGIGLAARALYEFTDLLPFLDMPSLADPPPALGKSTAEALRAGIYWGSVGGVRQLIDLLSGCVARTPQVYLTGGAAPSVAGLLAESAVYEPHLTLAGIALVALG